MATYDFTPGNGGANAVGTLETTGSVQMFVIGCDSASDGTDDAHEFTFYIVKPS